MLVLKHKHTPKETHELTQLKNEGETSGMTAAASQPQSEGVTGNGKDDWMSGLCFVVDLHHNVPRIHVQHGDPARQ